MGIDLQNSDGDQQSAATLCIDIYRTKLATIQNSEDNAAATNVCSDLCSWDTTVSSDCRCWSGLYLNENGKYWQWQDGTNITDGAYGFDPGIPPWRDDEPNGLPSQKRCARITRGGWADLPCNWTEWNVEYAICNGMHHIYILQHL